MTIRGVCTVLNERVEMAYGLRIGKIETGMLLVG